jgi:hypothetical protein
VHPQHSSFLLYSIGISFSNFYHPPFDFSLNLSQNVLTSLFTSIPPNLKVSLVYRNLAYFHFTILPAFRSNQNN